MRRRDYVRNLDADDNKLRILKRLALVQRTACTRLGIKSWLHVG